MKNKTFTYLNNPSICEIIDSAQNHVIYAAPSLSEEIARSLLGFIRRTENGSFRIIADADAEAFRLGFGDFSGIKILEENDVEIRKARGLRIAVLVADEQAWVYSPTPEIIFEQPDEKIKNAVSVSKDFVEQIIASIAPEVNLNPDVLDTSIISDSSPPEIGNERLEKKDVEKIESELKSNPPQKFDATRKVRVYTGYFQFVELSLIGCRFTSKTIKLPNTLLNLPADDEMRQRINSTCKLIDQASELTKRAKTFQDKLNRIRELYVKSLGKRFGSVILRSKKEEFNSKIEDLKKELEILKAEIRSTIQAEIDSSREKLTKMFLDGVIKNPPEELTSQLPTGKPTEESARNFIISELSHALPKTNQMLGNMEIHCDFKDVTYEMLNDGDFIEGIKAQYPYLHLDKTYQEEETLAKREELAQQELFGMI